MIYVISDLHGYPLERVKELLSKAAFGSNDYCFVLGDVIDRGDEGIDILRWMSLQPNMELILGNHEAMMLSNRFILDEVTDESISSINAERISNLSTWLSNGAQPTLNALKKLSNDQAEYIFEYIEDSSLYVTLNIDGKKFLLTHSGLGNFRSEKNLNEYTADELLWARPQLMYRYYDNITTVFGHTPTLFYSDEYAGKILTTDTWIDIDAGAACGQAPALLRLDDLKEFYLD